MSIYVSVSITVFMYITDRTVFSIDNNKQTENEIKRAYNGGAINSEINRNEMNVLSTDNSNYGDISITKAKNIPIYSDWWWILYIFLLILLSLH